MNNNIQFLIKEAETLNATKADASTKLKERLSSCPEQWIQATKNFIKKTNTNIELRQGLANELRKMTILTNPLRMIQITYELEDIDKKDNLAADMYNASMDEWE